MRSPRVAISSVLRSYRPVAVHAMRIGLVLALAIALRVAGRQRHLDHAPDAEPPLATVQSAIPEAQGFSDLLTPGGLRPVIDANGETVGYTAQTSPETDDVVGYRGSSNVLLVMNPDRDIAAASLISSRDTPEHVEAILRSPEFFGQFVGMSVGGGASLSIDAVSGATLTSWRSQKRWRCGWGRANHRCDSRSHWRSVKRGDGFPRRRNCASRTVWRPSDKC